MRSKKIKMSLEKILSISGKPGLYELKTQTRGGFIAESLKDGKKMSVSMRNNVSMLSEIAIYTYSKEIPLPEVFEKIYEKEDGKKSIDHKKSKNELSAHFDEILPEYDEDRVYTSDIKKIFQWYNLLIDKGFTSFVDEKEDKAESKPESETKSVSKDEEE